MFADSAVPTVPLIVASVTVGGFWVTKPVIVKSSPTATAGSLRYQVPVVAPVFEILNVIVVEALTFCRSEMLVSDMADWGLPADPEVTDPQVIDEPIFVKFVPSRL